MKVELEFELLKDEPKIETLIAGRVYGMDCVDKTKDVKARIVDEADQLEVKDLPYPTNQQIVMMAAAILGQPPGTADNRHPFWLQAVEQAERAFCALRASQDRPITWPSLPDLITLSVRHMPEEVKL